VPGGESNPSLYLVSEYVEGLFPEPVFKVFDYMAPCGKGEFIRNSDHKHIYVQSAFVLTSDANVSEDDINRELRGLSPVNEVRRMVEETERQSKLPLSQSVGVHIREVVDQSKDVPGIQNEKSRVKDVKAMGDIASHRQRCNRAFFYKRMSKLASEDSTHDSRAAVKSNFYLSSDSTVRSGTRVSRMRDELTAAGTALSASAGSV